MERSFKVYINSSSAFWKVKGDIELKVLVHILENEVWKDNGKVGAVHFDEYAKEELAERIGKSKQTVTDALSRLKNKNLLIRVARARYHSNPKYFFNGSELDRSKLLSQSIDYNIIEE